MNIEDAIVTDAGACYALSTLRDAARIMWERDCAFVPVVASATDARVVGVITDRDICMAAFLRGARLEELRVADTMSTVLQPCVAPANLVWGDDRGTACIRRLPVLDERGHLLGVLSLASGGADMGLGVSSRDATPIRAGAGTTFSASPRSRYLPPDSTV